MCILYLVSAKVQGSFPVISDKDFDAVQKFFICTLLEQSCKNIRKCSYEILDNQYEVGESNSQRQLILNTAKS